MLTDTPQPVVAPGVPRGQRSCVPKGTALSPREACPSQALLRENRGAAGHTLGSAG